MARIGFVGSGKDLTTLRATGTDSCYVGTWRGFQRRLQPGDTAVVTRADRISHSAKRREAVAGELAEAGITLMILDSPGDSTEGGA